MGTIEMAETGRDREPGAPVELRVHGAKHDEVLRRRDVGALAIDVCCKRNAVLWHQSYLTQY